MRLGSLSQKCFESVTELGEAEKPRPVIDCCLTKTPRSG